MKAVNKITTKQKAKIVESCKELALLIYLSRELDTATKSKVKTILLSLIKNL